MCNDRRNSSSPMVRFVYRQIKKHSVTAPILEDGWERERCERTKKEGIRMRIVRRCLFENERRTVKKKREKRETKDERAGLMRPRNRTPSLHDNTRIYMRGREREERLYQRTKDSRRIIFKKNVRERGDKDRKEKKEKNIDTSSVYHCICLGKENYLKIIRREILVSGFFYSSLRSC